MFRLVLGLLLIALLLGNMITSIKCINDMGNIKEALRVIKIDEKCDRLLTQLNKMKLILNKVKKRNEEKNIKSSFNGLRSSVKDEKEFKR